MTAHTYQLDLNRDCAGCGRRGIVVGTDRCAICLGYVPGAETPAAGQGDVASPPARGLAASLATLIQRTERARDQKFHALPLQHGLFVEVGLGQEFNLRLYRKTSYPSAREWQTVIAYLPTAYKPRTAVLPRDFQYTERDNSLRWYLEGHWPVERKKS